MEISYRKLFDDVINTSNHISVLYSFLTNAELKNGTTSNNYNYIVAKIKELSELEKKKLSFITSDSSILTLFKLFLASSDCERLKIRFSLEYDLLYNSLISSFNEKYDYLIDKYSITTPRETFLSHSYEEHGRDVLLPTVFNLIDKKKLVKIIDLYIAKTDNPEYKMTLIKEKNTILSSNMPLSNWYFSFGNDIDGLLIEIDSVVSSSFGIPIDKYLEAKNDYFSRNCDNLTKKALKDNLEDKDLRILYETVILSSLLSMDAKSAYYCYKSFMTMSENKDINDENINFIDDTYSKCSGLAKILK